jgi:DNA polymerase I-like protein with 3'-5' exonuclease and polymerase domains
MTHLPKFLTEPNPNVYLTDNYVVLDFETTNLATGSAYERRNSLVLACWLVGPDHPFAKRDGGIQHQWGSEYEQQGLLEAISRASFVIAHHSKFEIAWLARCGIELRSVLPYCTQIGEYVIAGNRKPAGGFGLGASLARYGLEGKHGLGDALVHGAGVCPSRVPASILLKYCERDVRSTHALFNLQRRTLQRESLLPTAYSRNLVTPCLVDIESKGMCLDETKVRNEFGAFASRYSDALKRFSEATGGINPRSAKQLRDHIYRELGFEEARGHSGEPLRTSGGRDGCPQPRTDKHVLPLLKATTDRQREFKQLALEVSKLKVPMQNLEKMLKVLDSGDRIVYANLNQTVTDTHRLSSSGRGGGFQFHNFDRAFKPLFTARDKGSLVVEADAPQLEFRVAAHLGRDGIAQRDIETGADIHAFTAGILGTSRQNAKAHTFKPLYGGQSGTPKEKAYYKAFRERYAGIYATQKGWTLDVLRDKKLRTATGLTFYWPDTESGEYGYIKNTPAIFNYPVQSLATADIIPLTLVLIWHGIRCMEGAFLVNTIHDSVIAEIPESSIDKYKELLVECFTKRVIGTLKSLYGIEFSVPLGVSIKHAPHWGEGIEEKFNG